MIRETTPWVTRLTAGATPLAADVDWLSGDRLAVISHHGGGFNDLLRLDPSTGSEFEWTTTEPSEVWALADSGSGRLVVFAIGQPGPPQIVLYYEDEATGYPIPTPIAGNFFADFSPDGQRLAVASGERVYIFSFADWSAIEVAQAQTQGISWGSNGRIALAWGNEVFSIAEMQSLFDLADVNAKASRLDPAKLGWLNQQYLKSDDPEAVAKHLAWHLEQCGYDLSQGPKPADIVIALRERVQTLKDMAEKSAVWFQPLTQYDEAAVAKHLTAAARAPLEDARARLAALPEWNVEAVSAALHAVPEALGIGMGKVAQPLRVAITGTQVSPDIAHTVFLAGRGQALARIDAALAKIPSGSGPLESGPASA